MKPTLAIVGMGFWGRKLFERFLNLDCKVKYLVDPAGVSPYDQPAGVFCRANSLSECVHDVDAVVIATPAATHPALASIALLAGKHVLCEKPLATDAKQAEKLFAMLHPGQVLMTGHTYLFHPTIQMFKGALPSAGNIRQLASVREAPTKPRDDCDVIADLLAHDVSIFNWFMGGVPCRVQSVGTRETARVVLWYGDTPAFVSLSWNAPTKVRQISVTGSAKSFSMDEMMCPPHPEPLAAECQHFLDCIKGAACISGPEVTWNVVRTLDAAERSLVGGGKLVEV